MTGPPTPGPTTHGAPGGPGSGGAASGPPGGPGSRGAASGPPGGPGSRGAASGPPGGPGSRGAASGPPGGQGSGAAVSGAPGGPEPVRAGGTGAAGPAPGAPGDGAVRVLVGLGRALDSAGLRVGADRVAEAVRAAAALDPARRADLYWAGRLTFCGSAEDIGRYDAVFRAVLDGEVPRLRPGSRHLARAVPVGLAAPDAAEGTEDGADTPVRAAASSIETLRHKDVTTLSAAERAELHRALAALSLAADTRPSRRRRPTPHYGPIDPRRTIRELLRAGGEPVRPRYAARTTRPRPVVLLVDVSGSMSGYADALLRFAHAAGRRAGRTEVFTMGTRLTRVTRELAGPDQDAAMTAVSAAVPDWSGGTRLGVLLREFLDRWGQRGTARGAVVVILSDGWERDDPALLGAQMRRLSLLAHRIVWANPRKARPGFAPVAGGLAAALPYVDDFVSGHSLAALAELAAVVAGTSRPAPAIAGRAGGGGIAGRAAGGSGRSRSGEDQRA
jgi:uncharacterized protein